MKIVNQSVELVNPMSYEYLLNQVELAGRVCYKSEDKITGESAEPFVRALIKRGHESVIEHCVLTVHFICDRGISHEIVRHRLASYSQESTRYCSYALDKFDNQITVVSPSYLEYKSLQYNLWVLACQYAEQSYFRMLHAGCKPEEARAVLPTSVKTELYMTANLREWRHFCKLRASPAAHPSMRSLATMLLHMLKANYPAFFEDLDDGIQEV